MTMEMPAPPRTVTSAGPARPRDERSVSAPMPAPPAPTLAAAAVETDATMPGPMPDLSDAADDEGTLILPEGAIVVLGADGKNTSHRLSAMCYIGRSDENQIRIQGEGVSRRHALIVAERNGFRIENLGSQNGVLVNGKPMQRGMLSPGDVITLGVVKLRFEQPGTARR
jgi:pSer/pThr/pTyr-binding forkhead associated (FHA) protein